MKSASEKQSRMVNVRMTEEEAEAFRELARELETSRSRLLRKVIRESMGEGPDLLPMEMKGFQDSVYQLASLGRNLNQLLKLAHSGKVPASVEEQALMVGIRDQVESLKKETLAVIDHSRGRSVGNAS